MTSNALPTPHRPAVTLRPMTADDLPLLHAWLRRAHVRQWWGDEAFETLASVAAKYLPRVLREDNVTPWIAMLGATPIGYCQAYVVAGDDFWPDETDPGARGCDQFLGEDQLLGRGLGTELVRVLAETIFRDPAVTKIQTDPAPDNARAIRCYEKAGFRPLRVVHTPDGAALLMIQERPRAA
jgi:aminoglycoside 6'-N-acetyltransferase-1b/aminoglycoside 6'-N-acetyltransferase-2